MTVKRNCGKTQLYRSLWIFNFYLKPSISSTFFARFFCTKDNCATFSSYVLALPMDFGAKNARVKWWWNLHKVSLTEIHPNWPGFVRIMRPVSWISKLYLKNTMVLIFRITRPLRFWIEFVPLTKQNTQVLVIRNSG